MGYEQHENSSLSSAYTSDGYDAGYSVTLTNGVVLSRALTRDTYRRGLITTITNSVGGVPLNPLSYSYDDLNRATSRNADTFGYNARGEVTSASILSNAYAYAYDFIGNHTTSTVDSVATTYAANSLNQYSQISVPSVENLFYDLDGNLLTNSVWSYTYDAENRLTAAYSNSVCVVSNAYDHASRRVLKFTPTATHTFIYDGWNLIQETVQNQQSTITNHYVWGRNLSGSLQGAGGVGGLLAVSRNGAWHFPFFDNNGNITAYVDEQGSVVASYTYDAFGGTIAQAGAMADAFAHRFSTKYFDTETGLYYYGYRFCSPVLHRWLNRDPIEEKGGFNLYVFCGNGGVNRLDMLGLFNQQSPYSVSVDVVWQERIRSEKGSYKFDRTYSGKSAFDVVVNPMECSADVNIKIKPSGAFSDETERNAQRWVDQVWNGRFKLCVKSLKEACPNGLALNIKISFVNEGQHHDVRFWNPFPPFQPNQTEWPTSYRADFLIPHEVGHMIGNHDEVLKVTVTDRYRGRVEEFDYGTGAHNIMGIGSNNEAYAYHYDFVARNVEQDAYVAPLVKSRKTGIFLNGREWLPASERKCQECKW